MPVSGCSSGSQYSSVTDVSRENSVRRTKRPLSFACDDTVVAPHSSYSSGSSSNLHSDYASFPHSHDRGPLIRDQDNASLIAETLQQIDNLGIELDSYCRAAPSTLTHQTIRFRSGSCKPPPPPERRNSTITAATSSAPSVAVMRAAGNTVSDQASKTTSVETRCIDQ
ncbi:hypothetical protein AB6A40_006438 [Gnathostoma spinigerum]|uniref:Uncharacterized protein n=1 Tax=Gnathostoma spinigerum TaxID=75299 RepID=A0ABD6ER20_9BILA